MVKDWDRLEQSRKESETKFRQAVTFKRPEDRLKYKCSDLLCEFGFLWWDEIGFFSVTADYKVPRIMGKKPGCLDKFCSCRDMTLYVVSIIVLTLVLMDQVSLWNTQKSQETILTP